MKKIIIIGAGPAGLTAAYCLLRQSDEYEVVILEESDAIGGISRTVNYKGNRMDIGGHRFFSKDDNVNKFWNYFMPIQGAPAFDDQKLNREKNYVSGGPDPEKDDRVMLLRHRVSRIYYKKKFFDYPVKMNGNTIKNMGIAKTGKAGFSYLKSCIHKLPESSLENFYINRFGKELYSMFFEGYTEKLWGRHPREISADWGAQRVKGLSVRAIIADIVSKAIPGQKNRHIETSLIEQFIYPKFGPGQLWEQVAKEIEELGGTIIKNACVTKLHVDDDSVSEIVYKDLNTQENKSLAGDIFISSMPLKDLVLGLGECVPQPVRTIASGLPYRDFVTIGLLVKKLSIKNKTKIKTLNNLVPDCWIYVQDPGVKLGRIQIFNNWSPYMVKDVENTVWIGLEYFCQENDDFWNLSPAKSAAYAAKELIRMGIIKQKEDILDFHKEQVKKAYPAYFDTYSHIGQIINYLDTVKNLYCVGRNGQHRYNNMDHSMVTSFETVKNILSGKKDKKNIWNVNTEAEYHESMSSKEKK